MESLRILHVVPYYEGAWAYGGIPRVVPILARSLAARGHRVTVCTTDACDASVRLGGERPAGVGAISGPPRLMVFPNVSNHLAYHFQLFLPIGLGNFLRRHAWEFDVAHVHGCHHVPGAIAARHLRRAAVPYVLTPHGTAPRIERRRVAKLAFDLTIGRRVTRDAARIVAVSEAERRQLAGFGISAAAIRVVPNALDLTEFEPPIERGSFRERFGLPRGEIVMFLGKLTPRKQVSVLIDAFAALKRPGATLVIAGNDLGAGPEIRRRVRDTGLEQHTRFTGLLTGRERLEALADADVLVYPSSDEVFGLVPLEAILCGTPVIVGDDSGCAEIVGAVGGGMSAPPGDAGHLARAIAEVLDDPARWQRAAHAAAPRIRARFAGDDVASLLEDTYREVLTRPSAVPVARRHG